MRENHNKQREHSGKDKQTASKSTYQQIVKQNERSKLFACIAYIPIAWIFSYFAERKNEFVRFHVRQGIKLTLLTLVIGSVAWALNAFFSWLFSYQVPTPTPENLNHVTTGVNAVGQTLCTIVAFVATIILVCYALFGVIMACRSKMVKLPLPGKQRRESTAKTRDEV